MRTYAVITERGPRNFSAYVPDLPGRIATGKTLAAVRRNIREAIEFHLDGLRQEGPPIPEPSSVAESVEIQAA
ncbi:MAG: type II toxin-antitoxin system HicB family antitoxin [Bryobacteraceae bacterium]|nr:type II toxin-antitoxin system HicB family antitoxin [Bryobacteraceae bacterium]